MNALQKYTVYPGQVVVTSAPSLITTVLGSCVSVCLWDKKSTMAGMNHYLLPGRWDDDPANANRGYPSLRMLIHSMVERKVLTATIEAKVFGGCNSLYSKDVFKVGARNVAMALETLENYNIHVAARHVGGGQGRKIIFNTETGKVCMQLLAKGAADINEEVNKGFGY